MPLPDHFSYSQVNFFWICIDTKGPISAPNLTPCARAQLWSGVCFLNDSYLIISSLCTSNFKIINSVQQLQISIPKLETVKPLYSLSRGQLGKLGWHPKNTFHVISNFNISDAVSHHHQPIQYPCQLRSSCLCCSPLQHPIAIVTDASTS